MPAIKMLIESSGADALKKYRVARMLVDVKGRVEAVMLLREKGIAALITCLDGLLPPLVAAGAKPTSHVPPVCNPMLIDLEHACMQPPWLFFAGYCLLYLRNWITASLPGISSHTVVLCHCSS